MTKNNLNNKKDNSASVKAFYQELNYNAPLPPPEHFHKYNEVVPGAAERILSMAEKQQSHRINMEERSLSKAYFSRNLGLFIGLLGLLFFTGIILFALYNNQNGVAISAICVAFTSITTAFILGRNKK